MLSPLLLTSLNEIYLHLIIIDQPFCKKARLKLRVRYNFEFRFPYYCVGTVHILFNKWEQKKTDAFEYIYKIYDT